MWLNWVAIIIVPVVVAYAIVNPESIASPELFPFQVAICAIMWAFNVAIVAGDWA